MKILYLSHRIPYPPNKGDKIRSFNEVKYLSKSHEIHLACLADDPDDLKYEKDLKKYCKKVCLLKLTPLTAKVKGLAALMLNKPLSVGYFYSRLLQRTVNEWISENTYDAVICFSSPMAEYVFCSPLWTEGRGQRSAVSGKLSQHTVLIMDFCDVDSDKWGQYSRQSKFPLNLVYQIENKKLLDYEKKVNHTFDHSFFSSPREADLFCRLYPQAQNVSFISNGVDCEYFSPSESKGPSGKRLILMFAGAMDYYANIDGVRWFCEEIFPGIKKAYPETQFYIVGSNPRPEVQNLAKSDSVTVTGFVEDIRGYYQDADICVIPLRIARGVQNKVLEAMSVGKAVVSSSAAIQGISATPGEHLLVADTPEEFIKHLTTLMENETLRKEFGGRAREFVTSHYDWETNMGKLDGLLVR